MKGLLFVCVEEDEVKRAFRLEVFQSCRVSVSYDVYSIFLYVLSNLRLLCWPFNQCDQVVCLSLRKDLSGNSNCNRIDIRGDYLCSLHILQCLCKGKRRKAGETPDLEYYRISLLFTRIDHPRVLKQHTFLRTQALRHPQQILRLQRRNHHLWHWCNLLGELGMAKHVLWQRHRTLTAVPEYCRCNGISGEENGEFVLHFGIEDASHRRLM